jgi:glycosyltransferase involved in cell wall biosynthesis
MYDRAACVIAGSTYTLAALPRKARQHAVYIPENGVHPACFNADERLKPSEVSPFRILFVGRLVPYKGADLVLESLATSSLLRREAELIIVGDGPQRLALENMAISYGLTKRVTFTGQLSQREIAPHFRSASVFAFPSLREFGGAVVIEAMACGLPCIVMDYGGPAEFVTPATGIRLPMASRHDIVASLRTSLENLAANRGALDHMSEASAAVVTEKYTWVAKARHICRIYESVLSSRHEWRFGATKFSAVR